MDKLKENNASQFLGKSILVVDDDVEVMKIIASILKEVGFKVYTAGEGLTAKNIIALNKPDVILSDVKMPTMDGVELLHHVRRSSKTPLVLMTGFSDIMEAKDAFKAGAVNLLSKPFSKRELLETLSSVFLANDTVPPAEPGETIYCRIPISDFTSGSKLKMDIFLKLSDQKYVRVAKQSFELSAERFEHFKSKGLEFFYVKREDFARYVGLNLKVAKVVSAAEKITKQQRLQVLKHTTEIVLQDTYVNGLDNDKFLAAKDVVELTVGAMCQCEDLVSVLEMLNSNSDFLYAHSLGVALYSSLIADEIGWKSTATKFKISMGGLLHDIGKKEIDPFILEKPRKDLNRHELEILESHSARGRDILSQISSVPSEVALIALQHHENCLGRGYPEAIAKDQIHPLAKLVSTANRFCELALKGPNWAPLAPPAAIDRILALNEREYDILHLAALMKIVNHPNFSKYEKKLEAEKLKTA